MLSQLIVLLNLDQNAGRSQSPAPPSARSPRIIAWAAEPAAEERRSIRNAEAARDFRSKASSR
jgi:hypothetical protein